MNFGIIEIGSTNTKAAIYNNNVLEDLGHTYIAFKNNYKLNNCLLESDIEELDKFISSIKKSVDTIYAFGTSIFRKMDKEELKKFTSHLKELDVEFKVVTADEESSYTVSGVINNIDYNKRMAVVIGGGGSTEVAIIDEGQVVDRVNLDFGSMDITDKFPDLKDDITTTPFNTILNYTLKLVGDLKDNVNVLVLAGGDYIHFYEKAGYFLNKNAIYFDDNQPYILDIATANKYDLDVMNKSLDAIRKENPEDGDWWNGVRGMRFCMNAVAKSLKARYIVPTKINMLIGIADEIANKNKSNT